MIEQMTLWLHKPVIFFIIQEVLFIQEVYCI